MIQSPRVKWYIPLRTIVVVGMANISSISFAMINDQDEVVVERALNDSSGTPTEIRPLSRPIDRIYEVVAGEADSSAVIQNPANLSGIAGINGVIDATWMHVESGRRGGGVAAHLAVPLVPRRLSLGLAYQWQYRLYSGHLDYKEETDPSFTRLSLGLGYSLEPLLPGVSVGLGYSKLLSRSNIPINKVNLVDLALNWRATRWLSMAIVGRGLNQPRIQVTVAKSSRDDAPGDSMSKDNISDSPNTSLIIPLEVQPEIAVRPWANKKQAVELAAGLRIIGAKQEVNKLVPYSFQPVVRLMLMLSGIRLFVSGQGITQYMSGNPEMAISAGLMIDMEHLGVGAAMHVNTESTDPVHAFDGGSIRFRMSSASYRRAVSIPARRVERIVLSDYRGERGLRRVVDKIDGLVASRDSLLLIESKASGFDYSELEEIREALFRFRDQGKAKVVVYMDGGGLRDYYLASAADRIIAHPQNSLQITGMSQYVYYYGDMLAKLGIHSEIQKVGQFKGQPEVYSSSGPSELVSKQRSLVLSDRWNHVVRQIARERGYRPLQLNQWINEAPYSPAEARIKGLVDDLAWPDQLESRLEDWVNRRLRVERSRDKIFDQDGYGRGKSVAILYIDGDLVDGNSIAIPDLFSKQVGVSNLINTIIRLRKMPNIKAIVLRINTRGGTIWAARAITRELELAAREKYVVASLGQQATSAGYYVATAAKYIFADATTLTGAIGAFHTKLDLSNMLQKAGVNVDIRSIGERATLNSWCLPSSPGHQAVAKASLKRFYDEFVSRVAKARSMERKEVLKIADGQVWSGAKAIELGLVDEYGGLREAIYWALRVQKLNPDWVNIVEFPDLDPGNGTVLAKLTRSIVGQAYPQYLGLAQLPMWTSLSHIVERLPAAIWTCGSEQIMAMSDADYRWD